MSTYSEIRSLGSGLQGTVSLCSDQFGSFALKQFKNRASFSRECEVLSRLCGIKNVVQLRPTPTVLGEMKLPLEYCANGELFDVMEHCGVMEETLAKAIFHQVLSGIKETHDREIAHLDIKPENIFFNENFRVVIGDYGLATLPNCRTYDEVRGTLSYMAPEVIQCCKFGTAYDTLSADIWSLGALLFVMLTGNNPFGQNNASKQDWYFVQISRGNWDAFWQEHEKYSAPLSEQARLFLQRCFTVSIYDRPTAAQLLDDEWFAERMDEFEYLSTMSRLKEQMGNRMAA